MRAQRKWGGGGSFIFLTWAKNFYLLPLLFPITSDHTHQLEIHSSYELIYCHCPKYKSL